MRVTIVSFGQPDRADPMCARTGITRLLQLLLSEAARPITHGGRHGRRKSRGDRNGEGNEKAPLRLHTMNVPYQDEAASLYRIAEYIERVMGVEPLAADRQSM